MNQEQLLSLVRSVLVIAGAWLVQNGYTTDAGWQTLMGGFITALPILWAMVVHSKVGIVRAAAALPEVAHVTVSSTPAGLALSQKVGSKPDAQVKVGS